MNRYVLSVLFSLLVLFGFGSAGLVDLHAFSNIGEGGDAIGPDERLMATVEEVQSCVGDLARALRSVEELNNAELFFKVQRKRVMGIKALVKLIDDSLARHQGSAALRADVATSLRKLNDDLNRVELALRDIQKRPTATADAHEAGDRLLRSEAFRALYEKRDMKPVVGELVTGP